MEYQQKQQVPGAEPSYTAEEERSIIQAAFQLAKEKGAFTRADIKHALEWGQAKWDTITAVCNVYHLVPQPSSSEEEAPTEDTTKSIIQTAIRLVKENPRITRMDILHELTWGPTQWIQLTAICDMYGIASPPSGEATKKVAERRHSNDYRKYQEGGRR